MKLTLVLVMVAISLAAAVPSRNKLALLQALIQGDGESLVNGDLCKPPRTLPLCSQVQGLLIPCCPDPEPTDPCEPPRLLPLCSQVTGIQIECCPDPEPTDLCKPPRTLPFCSQVQGIPIPCCPDEDQSEEKVGAPLRQLLQNQEKAQQQTYPIPCEFFPKCIYDQVLCCPLPGMNDGDQSEEKAGAPLRQLMQNQEKAQASQIFPCEPFPNCLFDHVRCCLFPGMNDGDQSEEKAGGLLRQLLQNQQQATSQQRYCEDTFPKCLRTNSCCPYLSYGNVSK